MRKAFYVEEKLDILILAPGVLVKKHVALAATLGSALLTLTL
jgi:hypothetical protein